jgi:transcriptional regulator with XRE-family HTH domain
MNFGQNVASARKKKGLSQDALAKIVGTISVTIGRYERNEIKPSIDIATKIAEALQVSLDYLVGNSDVILDKNLMQKISEIQKLPSEQQNTVNELLNAFLRDFKTKQAYQ